MFVIHMYQLILYAIQPSKKIDNGKMEKNRMLLLYYSIFNEYT